MSTENKSEDSWHKILGHCIHGDIKKLPNVVEGMNIKEKIGTLNKDYEICVQGKMSRQPDRHVTSIFELVHNDLAGPIDTVDINGNRYAITLTDDFFSAVFVYFLKSKNTTVAATKKFIADTTTYGRINFLRSDNRSEFKSNDSQKLLCDKTRSYSPHQNWTAERNWRTIFEMARCMVIENSLPKNLWTYAAMTSAVIRNRCFNIRLKQTQYYMITYQRCTFSDQNVMHTKT